MSTHERHDPYSSIHAYPPHPGKYNSACTSSPQRPRDGLTRLLHAPLSLADAMGRRMARRRRNTGKAAKEPDHIPRRASPVRSALYQASFALIVIITAVVLVASAWGLGEQAWRSGGQRRWNIVMVVGAYVAIVSELAPCAPL